MLERAFSWGETMFSPQEKLRTYPRFTLLHETAIRKQIKSIGEV